jgi:microcystin-dependent protein
MAQHDYTIANQSGAAFRADLNNALAAIVSQNSGAAEPSVTYAYMPWADTTAGVLKIRNAANSGWVTLYQLDGEWRYYDDDASNYVAFQAPATVSSNLTLTLPGADGTNGQALVTNGSGNLSFATVAPAGSIIWYAANTAPNGYLKANGANVSRTTYAALFAAIGTTFGVGDGSTTFGLPDLRGEFVRGWDDGRGIDTGRAFGSAQSDDLKSHTHTYLSNAAGNSVTGGPSSISDGETGSTTGATGGAETRPRNIALLACIKY